MPGQPFEDSGPYRTICRRCHRRFATDSYARSLCARCLQRLEDARTLRPTMPADQSRAVGEQMALPLPASRPFPERRVDCLFCGAAAGTPCVTRTGHTAAGSHAGRHWRAQLKPDVQPPNQQED